MKLPQDIRVNTIKWLASVVKDLQAVVRKQALENAALRKEIRELKRALGQKEYRAMRAKA